jgi:hypothetical protein
MFSVDGEHIVLLGLAETFLKGILQLLRIQS